MDQRLAPPVRLAFLLLIGVLLAFAFAPLVAAGLLGDDYRRLLAGDAVPAPRLWIAASAALWGIPAPGSGAGAFRFENLLLVVGCALSWFVFLKRAWSPWIGPVHARAAGASAAALFLLHPFASATVASLEARGDLLAVFLGLAGAAAFLWSRQEQRYPLTAASLALVLLGALCSDVALPLALLPVAAEFLSSRRHRRRSLRLRTTGTTLVLFVGGAALAVLVSRSRHAGEVSGLRGVRDVLLTAVEGLGRQVLPADAHVMGFGGVMLAGALLLVALQPAFRSARHAPRLWGGIVVVWGAALAATELYLALSGRTAYAGKTWESLPATLLVAALLGLTSSALRGERAFLVQALVAGGYAVLAHGESRAWAVAARATAALHRDLVAGSASVGPGPVLVLDPPRAVRGVDPVGDGLAWLLHPRIAGAASEPFDPKEVRGCSVAAFLLLARLEEFPEFCPPSTWLLAPAEALGDEDRARAAVKLWSGIEERAEPVPRRGSLTQTFDPELDPMRIDAVRVAGGAESPARELERLGWRPRSGVDGSVVGAVLGSEGRLEGFFDLSSALAWRLAGPVRLLVLEQAVRPVERWELLSELPALPVGTPSPDGVDWLVELADGAPVEGEYVLVQLALDDLECRETPLEHATASSLRARGAQRFVERVRARGAAVAWSLEHRIGAGAVGRLEGRSP